MAIEDEGTRQRRRMDIGEKHPAKLWCRVSFEVDVWIDPAKSNTQLDVVADNVAISMKNAIDQVAKELDAPDLGIEVMVR